jgi:hypothetical protein
MCSTSFRFPCSTRRLSTSPYPGDVPITTCPTSLPSGGQSISGPLPPRPDLDLLVYRDLLQDFTVTDAQALLATKDQCKNGGWQTYGVFKNQGDCVSYVATKGKNPPAGG